MAPTKEDDGANWLADGKHSFWLARGKIAVQAGNRIWMSVAADPWRRNTLRMWALQDAVCLPVVERNQEESSNAFLLRSSHRICCAVSRCRMTIVPPHCGQRQVEG
jgi:hypothetical protein